VLGDGAVHTVGREGDLAIDDATVSTAHAEIRRYGLQVLIRDVGSKHGLQIGGQPVEPRAWHAWRHGAVVTLGRAVLVLTGIPAPAGDAKPRAPSGDAADPQVPSGDKAKPVLQPEPRRDPPRELPPPRAPDWAALSHPTNEIRRGELHELALGDPDGPTHIKPRADHRLLVILGALAALAALLAAAGLVLYRFTR
jgi:pSer/pThr/pTyr-binding forkhead associated (FHA) protein